MGGRTQDDPALSVHRLRGAAKDYGARLGDAVVEFERRQTADVHEVAHVGGNQYRVHGSLRCPQCPRRAVGAVTVARHLRGYQHVAARFAVSPVHLASAVKAKRIIEGTWKPKEKKRRRRKTPAPGVETQLARARKTLTEWEAKETKAKQFVKKWTKTVRRLERRLEKGREA